MEITRIIIQTITKIAKENENKIKLAPGCTYTFVLTTELANLDRKPVKPARAPPDEFSAVLGIEFLKDLRKSSLTLLSFLARGLSPGAGEELRECMREGVMSS